MSDNIWELLQLEPKASKKEIRRQYARLSKECHPEENPEEFMKLQKAYREALEYIESSDYHEQDITIEESARLDNYNLTPGADDDIETTRENLLVNKLHKREEREFEESISLNIVKQIQEILQDEKRKRNQKIWQELFLSDEFLDVQFLAEMRMGLCYILNQFPIVENVNDVPSAFLTELVVAYGIDVAEDGKFVPVAKDSVEALILEFWFGMPKEWSEIRGCSFFKKYPNRARLRAFVRYKRLYSISEERLERIEEDIEIQDYVWKLEQQNFYENTPNQTNPNLHSKIYIKLMEHLFEKKKLPDAFAIYTYKKLALDKLDNQSGYKDYKMLKQWIENNYSDSIFKVDSFEEIKKQFVKEYIALDRTSRPMVEAKLNGTPYDCDFDSFRKKNEEFFSSELWLENAHNPEIISFLLHKGCMECQYHEMLDKMFDTYYDEENNNDYETDKERLLRDIMYGRNHSRLLFREPTDKLVQYILAYAYGIRTYYKRSTLPTYLRYIFCLEGTFPTVKGHHKVQFVDGSCLEYDIRYKYVHVIYNGNPAHISENVFLEHEKELVLDEDFFAMLSLVDFQTALRKPELFERMNQRLAGLLIPKSLRLKIIDAILNGYDQTSFLDKFEMCVNYKTVIYVNEGEDGFQAYSYNEDGLRGLESAGDFDCIEDAVAAYQGMEPKLTQQKNLSQMTKEQKLDAVFDGLLQSAQLLKDEAVNDCEDWFAEICDIDYVKAYMQREGNRLVNAYVELEGNVFDDNNGFLCISLLGKGIAGKMGYEDFCEQSDELIRKISRVYHRKSVSIGWIGSAEKYESGGVIVLDECGKLYAKPIEKSHISGDSIRDILEAYFMVETYTKMAVYSNSIEWSNQLQDYCFV